MASIEVNGATLYYESFGEQDPSQAPIVLIHGSTVDHAEWNPVIPALAEHYRVFAPDCRGHGKSNNPRMSYSFRELADDVAGFIRAMGFEKAHVIGHSNGGNVALVTLMEHPEIVQTCVIQAANAYVTRYLIEREPIYFDAARIEQDARDWMNEMILLHGEVNGAEYWRDLVWLTMKETISEPNYSPSELGRVRRPVLVIMGAKDTANAPDEHAQYIAGHIPNAELWIPEDTGHNVHLERTEAWIEKVLDFLRRRD